jgi:hypothetical protein
MYAPPRGVGASGVSRGGGRASKPTFVAPAARPNQSIRDMLRPAAEARTSQQQQQQQQHHHHHHHHHPSRQPQPPQPPPPLSEGARRDNSRTARQPRSSAPVTPAASPAEGGAKQRTANPFVNGGLKMTSRFFGAPSTKPPPSPLPTASAASAAVAAPHDAALVPESPMPPDTDTHAAEPSHRASFFAGALESFAHRNADVADRRSVPAITQPARALGVGQTWRAPGRSSSAANFRRKRALPRSDPGPPRSLDSFAYHADDAAIAASDDPLVKQLTLGDDGDDADDERPKKQKRSRGKRAPLRAHRANTFDKGGQAGVAATFSRFRCPSRSRAGGDSSAAAADSANLEPASSRAQRPVPLYPLATRERRQALLQRHRLPQNDPIEDPAVQSEGSAGKGCTVDIIDDEIDDSSGPHWDAYAGVNDHEAQVRDSIESEDNFGGGLRGCRRVAESQRPHMLSGSRPRARARSPEFD